MSSRIGRFIDVKLQLVSVDDDAIMAECHTTMKGGKNKKRFKDEIVEACLQFSNSVLEEAHKCGKKSHPELENVTLEDFIAGVIPHCRIEAHVEGGAL